LKTRIEILNQTLFLLPGKALYWKEKNLLIIADLHLGKTASFRSKGFALPGGTTTNDLNLITKLIEVTRCEDLLIIGDFLHSKHGVKDKTYSAVLNWRNENKNIRITSVMGNHDRRSGKIPAILDINYTDDFYEIPPFIFSHKPAEVDHKYVISGHVHPAVRLAGPGKQREKLPCFYFTENQAILPSFGSFTGNYVIEPEPCSRIFVIAGDEVVEVKQKL